MKTIVITTIAFIAISVGAQNSVSNCYEKNKGEIVRKMGSGDGMLGAQGWEEFEKCVPKDQRRQTLFSLYRELEQSGQYSDLRPAILSTIREYNGGDILSDPELAYYVYSGLHDSNVRLRRFIVLEAANSEYVALSCLDDPVDYIREVAICRLSDNQSCSDVYSLYVGTYKENTEARHSVETARKLLGEQRQRQQKETRQIENINQLRTLPKEELSAGWSTLWEHDSGTKDDPRLRVELLRYLSTAEGHSITWNCRLKYHLCSAIRDESRSVREALLDLVSTRKDPDLRPIVLSFLGDSSDEVRGKAIGYVKSLLGGDAILAAYVQHVAFKAEYANSRQRALHLLQGAEKPH